MSSEASSSNRTLVQVLRQQAAVRGEQVAFYFCPDGDVERGRLTYRELDAKARAIAASLQRRGAAGQRVLLVCRPGLDSVTAFFGCVYAGAVAITVNEVLPRLKLVVPDAQPGFVLATSEVQKQVKPTLDALAVGGSLQWCLLDEAAEEDPDGWVAPDIDAASLAWIQYTSGSTRAPKGVLVTHHNLLSNLAGIQRIWGGDHRDIGVWWLPQHHDFGLVAGVLEMVYVGCTAVLINPITVIRNPRRWLETISRYRATLTGAPNFAFDLCVKGTTPEERAALDLSRLSTVWNGAEPVRAETLRSFAEAFAPAGFRPEAFSPVYGLAETTLLAAGGSTPAPTVLRRLDRAALGANRVVDAAPEDADAVTLVGCGRPQGGLRAAIVDPETLRACGPDAIGEIWLAGASVGQGYWGRPEETERIFGARIADTGDGPFLRTGDLGFVRGGELFVAGRWQDLITIGDINYYPNDIEPTVAACHPALLSGRGAAVMVKPKPPADNQLVIVQEVDRNHQLEAAELAAVIETIRTAVAERHGVEAHDVVLVSQSRIPTTSSAKIQRGQCRQLFVDGQLEPLAEWHAPAPTGGADAAAAVSAGAGNLARFLMAGLAARQRRQRAGSPRRDGQPGGEGESGPPSR